MSNSTLSPETNAYDQFVQSKIIRVTNRGRDIDRDIINPKLFPFQKDLVKWAIGKGCAALFADTGLGKTCMQLEFARIASELSGKSAIIFAPIAVGYQTAAQADLFGIPAKYCKDQSEVEPGVITITNYERIDKFDTHTFGVVVLDESSILKGLNSKTRETLTEIFRHVEWKLACTATPAPNDHIELGNHSDWLGIMSPTAMLARWFVHDSEDTAEWRVKGHAQEDFWRWVTSWAACISKPSDMGYPDDGYILPGLNLQESSVHCEMPGDRLFHMGNPSATEVRQLKKSSLYYRVERCAELVASKPDEPWVIWTYTNDESSAVTAAIPGAIEVTGSMSPEMKESRLMGFTRGEFRVLVSKSSIAGFGMNWQHCANTIFASVDYSYEMVYQAIRRFYRFGQQRVVNAYIISSEAEAGIVEVIKRKSERHDEMKQGMVKAMREFYEVFEDTSTPVASGECVSTDAYRIYHQDCVRGLKEIKSDSIGFSVFSPPFASLYTYSDLPEDMGNCAGSDEFIAQFKFLVDEIHRVMMPGRNVSVHCMQLPMTKGRDGEIGLRDFRGDLIRCFTAAGFIFHSEVCIWKDPLVAMQRTKAVGLLHKQLCKDSTISRQGIPDYLVTFRKPGINPVPVSHGVGFDRYIGEDGPTAHKTNVAATNKFGHEVWQRYASPVWMDINQTDVLPYRGARDQKDERHICPLQLQVIERALELWSLPGDTVLSPFMGVGSEGYVSVKLGRKFVGFELKRSYFDQSVINIATAHQIGMGQSDLFSEANP